MQHNVRKWPMQLQFRHSRGMSRARPAAGPGGRSIVMLLICFKIVLWAFEGP